MYIKKGGRGSGIFYMVKYTHFKKRGGICIIIYASTGLVVRFMRDAILLTKP